MYKQPIDPEFVKLKETELVWLPEKGMGFYPVKDFVYDKDYFEKYAGYSNTLMGVEITKQRMAFVNKYFDGKIVDVGIGCGQFVESRPNTVGMDVNPMGVEWLKTKGLYFDPSIGPIDGASFWDSLEHIYDPSVILKNIQKWVFVSLPIFKNCEHLLKSKHFKKEEHCWYWTSEGFISWMKTYGFECKEVSNFESLLGRDEIWSYVFEKI